MTVPFEWNIFVKTIRIIIVMRVKGGLFMQDIRHKKIWKFAAA